MEVGDHAPRAGGPVEPHRDAAGDLVVADLGDLLAGAAELLGLLLVARARLLDRHLVGGRAVDGVHAVEHLLDAGIEHGAAP